MDSDKFQNKYRIQSTRLRGYDYSSKGYYFITICTDQRRYWFGDIVNREMHLNDIGITVDRTWNMIRNQYNHIELDEYVIMPNHIHGIICIDRKCACVGWCRCAINRASTVFKNGNGVTGRYNPMGTGSLSEIIRWFKGRCTYEIRKGHNNDFKLQSRFHDHIIRNDKSLNNIRRYIINNPKNWELYS